VSSLFLGDVVMPANVTFTITTDSGSKVTNGTIAQGYWMANALVLWAWLVATHNANTGDDLTMTFTSDYSSANLGNVAFSDSTLTVVTDNATVDAWLGLPLTTAVAGPIGRLWAPMWPIYEYNRSVTTLTGASVRAQSGEMFGYRGASQIRLNVGITLDQRVSTGWNDRALWEVLWNECLLIGNSITLYLDTSILDGLTAEQLSITQYGDQLHTEMVKQGFKRVIQFSDDTLVQSETLTFLVRQGNEVSRAY